MSWKDFGLRLRPLLSIAGWMKSCRKNCSSTSKCRRGKIGASKWIRPKQCGWHDCSSALACVQRKNLANKGAYLQSRPSQRMFISLSECCGSVWGLPPSRCSLWSLASESTPPCSALSTQSCVGRWPTPIQVNWSLGPRRSRRRESWGLGCLIPPQLSLCSAACSFPRTSRKQLLPNPASCSPSPLIPTTKPSWVVPSLPATRAKV